jgi:hypothetical protein
MQFKKDGEEILFERHPEDGGDIFLLYVDSCKSHSVSSQKTAFFIFYSLEN